MFINKEYPWLHATPDFLCSCDCCGEECGEVKCPFCIDNCDFESCVSKSSSCLRKDSAGNFWKESTVTFVVCAFEGCGATNFFHQRILLEEQHWNSVLPKFTKFWRTCILPEVLGKWYTSRHFMAQVQTDKQPEPGGIFAISKRTLLKKVSFVVIPNVPLFLLIYHLSRLKAFQKLGTAPIAETYQSSKNQGKPK